MSAPSGTVTFLFTDIEGSTRLWQADEAAMRAALSRHDELLRKAVAEHDGSVFSSMGDGVAAVFSSAASAAGAALSAQESLAAESWPTTRPLRVRMAIHTGEAEARDGDYFGTAVNRAARLMAVGHGGQVLCSASTAALLGDASPIDLGEHRLRDLDRPMHVFQLGSGSFPRLRSMDAYPGNLPLQLSSFVGRENELSELREVIIADRLITLTGSGGVGKTRLALQAGAEAVSEFPDGVWLCELSAVSDRESMLSVVAGALGSAPREAAVDGIAEFIGDRRMLVILDNCEHLLDDAADLAVQVVAACRHLVVLATSREALAVTGERVLRLRSLETPSAGATPDELAQVAASRLFLDRAAAAGAEMTLTEAESRAVAEVCRRLDGIPLAIELAAARTIAMGPVEVAARLDERFRLLTGGRRASVERHHTLRAAIDWSYSTLSAVEQAVFDRLGVFPASFDVDAAQSVAGADDIEAWDVVDALTSLVAKSLVSAERTGGGSTRYQMLESLRHYAREQLDRRGEGDSTRRQHARHYARLSDRFATAMQAGEEDRWNAEFTDDNLRSASRWALDSSDPADNEFALAILATTSMLFNSGGVLGIYGLADEAIGHARRGPARYRGAILAAAAWSAFFKGDLHRAVELSAEADESEASTGSVFDGNGHLTCRLAFAPSGEIPQLIADGQDRLERQGATPWTIAYYLANAVSMAALRGHLQLARAKSAFAMAVANRVDSPSLTAAVSYGWALAWWQDDPEGALRLLEKVPQALSMTPNSALAPRVWALKAQLTALGGNPEGALPQVGSAIAAAHAGGDRQGMATVLARGAFVFHALVEPETVATFDGIIGDGQLGNLRPLPPHEMPGLAKIIEEMADALGPDRYQQAYRQGAAMTYQHILGFATDRTKGPAGPLTVNVPAESG